MKPIPTLSQIVLLAQKGESSLIGLAAHTHHGDHPLTETGCAARRGIVLARPATDPRPRELHANLGVARAARNDQVFR